MFFLFIILELYEVRDNGLSPSLGYGGHSPRDERKIREPHINRDAVVGNSPSTLSHKKGSL